MFAIEQPAMALNDARSANFVEMTITKMIQPDEGISTILAYVVNEAKALPGGKLKNLIFNCHGTPGELKMGVGIDRNLTNRFSALAPDGKPMVDVIYLRACYVAQIEGPATMTDGNLFCSEIAKNAKCMVVASTAIQSSGYKYVPHNMLDRFEGTTLVYGPEGNVLKTETNPMYSRWSNESE